MKKIIVFFIAIAVSLSVPFVINNAHAEGKWQLYDAFDGLGFDGTKWDKLENGGVQIDHDAVNERAEFYFPNGAQAGQSSWLQFIDCSENIVAIKATFTTEGSCSNPGVRGRIGLHEGTFEGMYSWHQMDIQPGDDRIWGSVDVQYDAVQDLWYTLFYGEFRLDLDLSHGSYTLEIHYDKKQAVFEGGDFGRMTFELPSALGAKTEIFRGIGLRANSSSGSCTFYVDDVYVMRKGPCDNKAPKAKKIGPKNKLPLNACWAHITFNEPMACCWWNIQSDPNWPMGPGTDFYWSDDMKTISVKRNNCVSLPLLPPNTNLEFIVNPNGTSVDNYFRDLKGNAAKTKKLKIKTAK